MIKFHISRQGHALGLPIPSEMHNALNAPDALKAAERMKSKPGALTILQIDVGEIPFSELERLAGISNA